MPTLTLEGSHRALPRNASPVQKRVPTERIVVTLALRAAYDIGDGLGMECPSRAAHAYFAGASPADIHTVEQFAQAHGLQVDAISQPARTVKLSGDVFHLGTIFGVSEFCMMSADDTLADDDASVKAFRVRTGTLTLPHELLGVVVAVLGLDDRPVARTQHTVLAKQHAKASGSSLTPKQVAARYGFPTDVDGTGQTVAIIELGGGYQGSDLAAYFGSSKVSVTAVGVDGAANTPSGDSNSADGEVCLDIEVVGAIAPGAKQAVYFAPNTDQGFLDAINAAIHDTVRKPSVISISWGGPEIDWTAQAMNAYNAAFHDAALLGITVTVAAGDNGSSDGVSDGKNHVDFPASSPWVLACGGTSLTPTSETVWNGEGATGGGFSTHFSKPTYFQEHIAGTGRGVPDVAGNADPETGYIVNIDGETTVIGGTSAVAPLWAAFIALMNQKLGKHMGWINQILYANPSALNDVTEGTNGAYSAGPGWDACTGLGTPNGAKLLELFLKVRG